MFRRTAILGMLSMTAADAAGESPYPVPLGYKEVWSDNFTSLSLRTGGPTYTGLAAGSGTWSAPGAWWSNDPRGVAGYGYDWFIDPSYYGWPAGYHGQFAITSEGLRIRAEPPTPAIAAMLPKIRRRHDPIMTPWMSGQINSFHAVRINPPFYFEARAKLPVGIGLPWVGIWLNSGARGPGLPAHSKEYEIDIHEGFGDSDRLHATIHWSTDKASYLSKNVANIPSEVDLSAGFNIWGCNVTKDHQIFYFNGVEIGRVNTPTEANADQPFGILLSVSAGLPWNNGGPPSGGPHDMIVRYVRLYAPDTNGLIIR